MATLNLAGLSKTYFGGVRAVSDVSFDVDDGEFIVLVGPSGCGKSTILRMIAGLEAISEGTLTIGGDRANDKEPGARDIAMVFQNYALYPHMSVRGNMAYGLKNEGLPKDQIAERIAEASRILQLEPYLDRKPRQLSGGQRQRVAMGRAIVRKPEVFLFDEPLSNLDAKLRTQLRHELKALHQRLGATFIYVTHDQVEAMSLADRIILMNRGQVEQIGTSMELYDRPASRFVAEFIGTPAMNILPATLGDDGRSVILTEGQGRIALPLPVDAEPGRALSVGLRPEHLRVDPATPILRMTVRFIEQLGADSMVHGLVEGTKTEVTLRVAGTQHFDIGQTVPLASSADHLHLFDGSTGKRLG